jgi:hypothetical protein
MSVIIEPPATARARMEEVGTRLPTANTRCPPKSVACTSPHRAPQGSAGGPQLPQV